MASNYVEIKVKASDTAKPDLDALKFELDALGAKVETARVDVDDKDAAAKLLALNARLVALDKKVANPRLNAAGAAKVEADIAAVDAALGHLNDKHADPKVTLEGAAKVLAEVDLLDHELDKLDRKADNAGPGGLLGKIISGAGGASIPGGLPLIGGLPLPALAGIIPVAGALLTEVTGLVSGFAAAGAGAGAFGLLAAPAIKSVSGALAQVKTDQNAYDRALTATAKNNALKHLHMDLAKLDPAQRGAVRSLQELSASYHAMAKGFEPEAFKLFGAGLKLVSRLLPDVTPFARTFADVLAKLLGQASRFASSKGFADWLKQFHSIEGPALNSIGQGIGKVTVAFGKLLTVMSGKGVAHAINIAFDTIAVTINAVAGTVRFLVNVWDGAMIAGQQFAHGVAATFAAVRHAVASFGHEIATDFNDVRHWNAMLAHDFAATFDHIRANLARWAADVGREVSRAVSFFRTLPGRILAAERNFGSLLFNAGRALIQGLINGIKSMFGPLGSVASSIGNFIASLKGPLPADLLLLVPHGQAIMTGLMNGMGSKMPQLKSQLGGISSTIAGTRLAGGGGGGGAVIQLAPVPGGSGLDALFWTWLRNGVRAQGGDPSMFNRKV